MAAAHQNSRSRNSGDKYFHFGFGSRRFEPVRHQRSFHRHSEVECIFLEQGGIDHLVGGQRVTLSAGRFAVFWGAIPHAPLAIEPGTIVHRLTLPLPWFLHWQLPSAFTQAILAGDTIMELDHGNAATDLQQFARWHEDLKDGSGERRKLVLLECEARLRRLYLSTARTIKAHDDLALASRNSSKVEQMSRFVATHYAERLTVMDIAKSAGLHPNYAATLFRRTCGRSLLEFINEHRISHAQRLLATTDVKIIDLALMTGFGSPSRFYCAFKKTCAQTPRAYRRTMGLPGGPAEAIG